MKDKLARLIMTNDRPDEEHLCSIGNGEFITYDDITELEHSEMFEHLEDLFDVVLEPYGPYRTIEIMMSFYNRHPPKQKIDFTKVPRPLKLHFVWLFKMGYMEMRSAWDPELKMSRKRWFFKKGYDQRVYPHKGRAQMVRDIILSETRRIRHITHTPPMQEPVTKVEDFI